VRIGLLCEGAVHETAASISGGNEDSTCTANTAVVRYEGTITTQTSGTTIENGRLGEIIGIGEPVPVLVT
jgi:hypothetical protein